MGNDWFWGVIGGAIYWIGWATWVMTFTKENIYFVWYF